jgi:hypothetical protein
MTLTASFKQAKLICLALQIMLEVLKPGGNGVTDFG